MPKDTSKSNQKGFKVILGSLIVLVIALLLGYWKITSDSVTYKPTLEQIAKNYSQFKTGEDIRDCENSFNIDKINFQVYKISTQSSIQKICSISSSYCPIEGDKVLKENQISSIITSTIVQHGYTFPCGNWYQTIVLYFDHKNKLIFKHIEPAGECL